MTSSDIERKIENFYQNLWANPSKINRTGQNVILGYHYGFFEKGIKSINEAMLKMNEYLESILDLDKESSINILDAGSGIGYTSIYLAQKYLNCNFYGITLASNELRIAQSLQKRFSIKNVFFKQGSYMDSDYPENFFNRIFALESLIYAPNKTEFLYEMQRILKPKGKLIIIDTFTKNNIINSLTKNIENFLTQKKFSEEELSKNYMNIEPFISNVKNNNFVSLEIKNLVETKNIKISHIYGFLIYRSFLSIKSQLCKLKKGSKAKFHFSYPFLLSIFFIYKILIIFVSQPRYYSIIVIKK
jgi:ubiquinone/menaquinone biosynthesis C-methylase UbiE